jgi:hypothetical protein
VTDAEVLSVIQKMAKQRRDSIEQYKAGGRDDLAGGVLLVMLYATLLVLQSACQQHVRMHCTEYGVASGVLGAACKAQREKHRNRCRQWLLCVSLTMLHC